MWWKTEIDFSFVRRNVFLLLHFNLLRERRNIYRFIFCMRECCWRVCLNVLQMLALSLKLIDKTTIIHEFKSSPPPYLFYDIRISKWYLTRRKGCWHFPFIRKQFRSIPFLLSSNSSSSCSNRNFPLHHPRFNPPLIALNLTKILRKLKWERVPQLQILIFRKHVKFAKNAQSSCFDSKTYDEGTAICPPYRIWWDKMAQQPTVLQVL